MPHFFTEVTAYSAKEYEIKPNREFISIVIEMPEQKRESA